VAREPARRVKAPRKATERARDRRIEPRSLALELMRDARNRRPG
jgi:hypothetical protein